MHIGDYIVLALVALGAIGAVLFLIRQHRTGKTCCGCSGCNGGNRCHPAPRRKTVQSKAPVNPTDNGADRCAGQCHKEGASDACSLCSRHESRHPKD